MSSARHRLRAAIQRVRRGLVAMRAHQGEFGFGHARLQRGHAHAGAVQVRAQAERELADEGLGAAVDVAAGIRIGRRGRTDVDDRAAARDQRRQQRARERRPAR